MATPYVPPLEDMLFTLEHIAAWRGGVKCVSATFAPEDIRAVMQEAGRLCTELIAPLNQAADHEPCTWRDGEVTMPAGWREAYAAWAGGGWNGIALPQEYGGTGMPVSVGSISMEMLTSACMALGTLPVLTQGAVDALHAHADEPLKSRFLAKLVSGEWTATMDLTEPQAGSDLGALRTAAVPGANATYRLRGKKIFITYGEHNLADNIIHLVLARLPNAPVGSKGISLFVVPKFFDDARGQPGRRNDMRCTGIEHKLGIRASPTCSMSYGEHDGATGWLVGEAHQGLACMFTMMNKARLAIGLQGVAIAERSLQQALAYAAERRQGRLPGGRESVPILHHADVMRNLLGMMALTAASRAMAYLAAAEIDRAAHAEDDRIRLRAAGQAALLTPLVKAFATDAGLEVSSLGIQIHGGMGYVEDTGAAQHWRDARIAPIYEGTNGIQAIDFVTRKLRRDEGAAFRKLMADMSEVTAQVARMNDRRLGGMPVRLSEALACCERAVSGLLDDRHDEASVLAVASPALKLAATTLGGVLLAKGALAAIGQPSNPSNERRIVIARFYAEALLPAVLGLEKTVAGSGGAVLEADRIFQ